MLTYNVDIMSGEVAFLCKERRGIDVSLKKDETELSAALFLWRERQCDLYPGMVYVNRTAFTDGDSKDIPGQESLFCGGSTGKNPFDQYAGRV